jgi:hypothetical protein
MAMKAALALFQNCEVAWIRALSESRSSLWFHLNRMRDPHTGQLGDGLAQ